MERKILLDLGATVALVHNVIRELGRSGDENDLLWLGVQEAVVNGMIRELVRSGDEIPITLKNGETHVAVATYDKTGKLFFVFQNCLQGAMPMNVICNKYGGWSASFMRDYLNSTVFKLLPDALLAVIAPTRITQVLPNGRTVTTEDKLFLLSRTHVFGSGDWSRFEPEDTQLDIFENEHCRLKSRPGFGPEAWWLRSISASGIYPNGAFDVVRPDNSSTAIYANDAYGVVPAFCL